ncbi:MAG TPA: molecular chaperone HscC [Stellaceae bacterium]|nr:molecular chaperone HscC [Stellaceae bacterium]
MIIGIDLGTTNSLVGYWRNDEAILIPNALGHLLTPSCVSLGDDGQILVGLPARERLASHPHRTAAAFKRYMGTERLHFLGEKGFRPEELSALVLRSLKSDAEASLGQTVHEAVITVPAYFNDAQRKATKAAGELAGLKVDILLTEPTAAALAYGLIGGDASDEQTLLVVDLGGGTFDVSVLHCFEGVTEVRATAGDSWLGGEDFVDAIVAAFMTGPGRDAGLPMAKSGASVQGLLRRQAELAKRELSDHESATIEVPYKGKAISWTLSRDTFEQISEPLLLRLRSPIERALRDARVRPTDLTRIIFAGGATRMPMFRRLIARLFQRLPVQHINPDEVVGRGAAVRAGMRMRDEGLKESVLTDVCPFTLGIETTDQDVRGRRVHGLFSPIIERNTIIPASRSKTFSTIDENQRAISVRVFQGEGRLSKDNILLGAFKVRVPPGPAGKESIDVRFTYDTSGLLEVEASVLSTKMRERIVIEGNAGVLSREQIKERLDSLAKLKVHPRNQAENMAVIARAERLYEERLGVQRDQIGGWLTEFLSRVEDQDPTEIEHARSVLAERLDAVDDKFFL